MLDTRRDRRLAFEPEEPLAGRVLHVRQYLQRDDPAEPRVLGLVDDSLSAAADLAKDPVGADPALLRGRRPRRGRRLGPALHRPEAPGPVGEEVLADDRLLMS